MTILSVKNWFYNFFAGLVNWIEYLDWVLESRDFVEYWEG